MLLKFLFTFVEIFTSRYWFFWFGIFSLAIQVGVKISHTFLTYWSLHWRLKVHSLYEPCIFTCRIMKKFKGLICPVTFRYDCLFYLFISRIFLSWEARETFFRLFFVCSIFRQILVLMIRFPLFIWCKFLSFL